MKKRIPLLTLIMIMLCTVCVNAGTMTSGANKDSKPVRYVFTANAVRTSPTQIKVNWHVSADWPAGSEGHGAPTKITATVKCGSKDSWTLKSAGSNTLHNKSGTSYISVGPKDTSFSLSFKASGAGEYIEAKQEKYTYYTTKYAAVYAGASSHKNGDNSWPAKAKADGYSSCNAKADSRCSVWYSPGGITGNCGLWSKSVKHTGTRTVYVTHKTNSGNLKKWHDITVSYPTYVYVNYDTLGGTPQPSQGGFVYNQGTKVTSTVPKITRADIGGLQAYVCQGWSKTSYNLNSIRDKNGKVPDFNTTGTQTVYDLDGNQYTDSTLYAAYRPNKVCIIKFHGNPQGEGGKVDNVPDEMYKWYNVNERIPMQIPIHSEVVNKGERYVFLWWNTKPDGSGYTYRAGSEYDRNNNPHESISIRDGKYVVINLYAQWFDGSRNTTLEEVEESNQNIRYIDKDHQNTLTKDSQWRSGQRQQIMGDSLEKDGSNQAKSIYDSHGNKIN